MAEKINECRKAGLTFRLREGLRLGGSVNGTAFTSTTRWREAVVRILADVNKDEGATVRLHSDTGRVSVRRERGHTVIIIIFEGCL